jgi:sugar-specific transcriptional regulator TrmB
MIPEQRNGSLHSSTPVVASAWRDTLFLVEEVIVSRMRDVGFSLYEARVYLALLREGWQNGNEVAKHAAVPSSKVYAALAKLADEGFAQSSRQGTSIRWAAVPPQDLVARLRRHYNEPLNFLLEELPKIQALEPSEPFLTVSGLTATLEAATALIDASERELHVSCWEADLEVLRRPLAAASERGVRVFGMLYGRADPPPGSWLHHHYEEIVASRLSGRLLALVADDAEALIARMPDAGETNAVRSRNPVMTLIVKEYLHHDHVLQRAQMNIGFEEWDKWWQADPELRSEILGQAIHTSSA